MIMEKQRLSWEEIKSLYPEQHVGLVDVVFKDEYQMNVESAIVKYTDKDISDGQLMLMAQRGEIVRRYTSLEESKLLLGALTVW